MPVRVGAQIQPQQASYAQMRDAWLRVEEMGADTLFSFGALVTCNSYRNPNLLADMARTVDHKNRILDEWCQKVGRDPKEIERSVNLRVHRVRKVDRYVENGFTHLMIGVGGPDYDLSPLRDLISWRDEYRERDPEAAAS